jgi:hypothetical protein
MKIVALLAVSLLAASGVAFAAAAKKTPAKPAPGHPPLSAQEMLVDCAECHKAATPEIEKEWYDSKHGLAMVKCYQCHGSFENFVVTPSPGACAACHADRLAKCPQNKACWQCHIPHTFAAKK